MEKMATIMTEYKYGYIFEEMLGKKANVDAIIGLAIATSFLRNDWDNQTSVDEVDNNALLDIAEMAEDY